MYEKRGNETANFPSNPAGEEGRGKGGQATGPDSEHGDAHRQDFLFCFCQKMLSQLCEVVNSTEFLEEIL